MVFNCKDGRKICYVQVSPTDTERIHDFFLEDVIGIIKSSKLDISNIYYILNVEPIIPQVLDSDPAPKRFTNIYVDMLKEFIEAFDDQFIIMRIGFDPKESNESLLKMHKILLRQEYPAVIKSGFIDISVISGLEFSKCLLYNNETASQFLEIASRYEIMEFIGDEFSYDQIFQEVSYSDNKV